MKARIAWGDLGHHTIGIHCRLLVSDYLPVVYKKGLETTLKRFSSLPGWLNILASIFIPEMEHFHYNVILLSILQKS